MAGHRNKKVVADIRSMVAKAKKYGKKAGNNLVSSFNQLTLSPKSEGATARTPLTAVSNNLPGRRPEVKADEGAAAPERAPEEPLREVTEQPFETPPQSPVREFTERPTQPEPQQPPTIVPERSSQRVPDRSLGPIPEDAPVIPERSSRRLSATKFDTGGRATELTNLKCVKSLIQSFDVACIGWKKHFKVTKIGQGSYATIFRMQFRTQKHKTAVFKLMPIKPKKGIGSRALDQTSIMDAVSEVKALDTMADIDGFVEFRSACVLQGSLPLLVQDLNEQWDENHQDDEPTLLTYPSTQLWLLTEMSYAGTDLETLLAKGLPDNTMLHKDSPGQKLTIHQTWDIFWSITEALARGEHFAKFEHRDLHPGNICIQIPTHKPHNSTAPTGDHVPKLTNLEITIIDYTLSRFNLQDQDQDTVHANSMQDPWLFQQSSENDTDNRQYEMYRAMQNLMSEGTTSRDPTKWSQYIPMTNILWLYHILTILVQETEFFSQDLSGSGFPDAEDTKLAERLTEIRARMDPSRLNEWTYLSAGDVLNDELAWKRNWVAAVLEEGEGEVSGEALVMTKYRRERWERCVALAV